jgi:hypothetical protein
MLIPISIFADIKITEIMYDLEGSDAGREWIEIYNNGSNSFNLNDLHFYEADVHHGLISEQPVILSPNEYALIVQDVDLFKSTYPSNIKIVKSSFSLANTSEELAISNEEKVILFSVSYSSEFGAVGNGNSLHYGDAGWFESSPTPGAAVGSPTSSVSQGDVETDQASPNSTQNNKAKIIKRDYYTAHIKVSEPIIKDSTVSVEAYVIHTKDTRTTKKIKGVYYFNFGDGNSIETDKRINIDYVYKNPGTYTLVLEHYSSTLARESGKEPNSFIRKKINVHKSDVDIIGVDNLGGIMIQNNISQTINLNGWDMTKNESVFTFPRYSLIDSGQQLTIPVSVHNLKHLVYGDWVLLRNEHDNTIFSFTQDTTKMQRSQNDAANTVQESSPSPQINEKVEVSREISHIEKYLDQHPDKLEITFDENNYEQQDQKESLQNIPVMFLLGSGILSLVLVGIRLFFMNKNKTIEVEEESSTKIELIN